MLDVLRLVSSDDIGKDESNVQTLLKKHKDITDELKNYASTIDALHEQVKKCTKAPPRRRPVENDFQKNNFFVQFIAKICSLVNCEDLLKTPDFVNMNPTLRFFHLFYLNTYTK
jgi:hypothetical protein